MYYCKTDGKDIKTFMTYDACGVYLYVQKEINCFLKYLTEVKISKI